MNRAALLHCRRAAILAGLVLWAHILPAQETPAGGDRAFPLSPDGAIPAWLVAGPFEQSTTGFGTFSDVDAVGEASAMPVQGKDQNSPMVQGGKVAWRGQSADERGYLDFNATLGWARPSRGPEKLVTATAGYAYCTIESPDERDALLLFGSNSELRVFLDGTKVFSSDAARNAVRDNDTVRVRLKVGKNRLLLKVGNSHRNYWLTFFGVPEWGWGLFARVVGPDLKPPSGLSILVPAAAVPSYTLRSTFFFKKINGRLQQRIDLVLYSPFQQKHTCSLRGVLGEKRIDVTFKDVPFGETRRSIYIPPPDGDTPIRTSLTIGPGELSSIDTIRKEQQYELHLMFLTHTDIGYTNPQPVVKERHLRALDQVVEMCSRYPDFRWTLETAWPLKEYEKARPAGKFMQLIDHLRSGRIALSPLYTNPFTGMVSQEEMLRAFRHAEEYSRKYAIPFRGAVYNDVPGFSWFMPQALNRAGVSFLACGLNEFFNNYSFQRSLPKAFRWKGSDGSRVLTYLTETYIEGAAYGLERDSRAIEHRTWERLHRLRANGYAPAMVLLNASQGDNADVARSQFLAARKWNEEYAYPRFVFTTLNDFAQAFEARYGARLPEVTGDWTSTWDILYQGEPARMIRQRWAQHHLPEAEALATISALLDSSQTPLGQEVQQAYDALLLYSGHGSGLEAGYGTRTENAITVQYREQYVREAWLRTEELLQRSVTRLAAREEEFEVMGGLVFNGLSWDRDAPMIFELKDSSAAQYTITDFATGKTVPSHRDGYQVYLVAPGLPSMGYKKLRADQGTAGAATGATDLRIQGDTLENAFYRLVVDPGRRRIASIVTKQDGRELVDTESPFEFAGVARRRQFAAEPFTTIPPQHSTVRIVDQRPARVRVEWSSASDIVEQRSLTLWSNVDRIDLAFTVNLGALTEPSTPEEYSITFPFSLAQPTALLETLGGFLDPARDQTPGSDHTGFSIRQCAALTALSFTAALACVDSRVVFVERDTTRGRVAFLANVVNNFPKSWNRNEETSGRCEFRFSIQGSKGAFDAGRVARFGQEVATDPAHKVTFFRSSPGERKFVDVSSRSVLLTAFGAGPVPAGYFLRLLNVDPKEADTVQVLSEFLHRFAARRLTGGPGPGQTIPITKGALSVRLGPNECVTILLEPREQARARK